MRYSINCWAHKIKQVFHTCLQKTQAFFAGICGNFGGMTKGKNVLNLVKTDQIGMKSLSSQTLMFLWVVLIHLKVFKIISYNGCLEHDIFKS